MLVVPQPLGVSAEAEVPLVSGWAGCVLVAWPHGKGQVPAVGSSEEAAAEVKLTSVVVRAADLVWENLGALKRVKTWSFKS